MIGRTGTSEDLGVTVRSLRKKLREREAVLADINIGLAALRKEADMIAAEEEACFNTLAELRHESNDVIRLAATSADVDLADALMALVLLRKEEDTMTLMTLASEAKHADEEAAKLIAMLRAQRAEGLRSIKQVAGDHKRMAAEVGKTTAEIARYREEQRTIVERTEAAALKHARELFGA